MKSLIAFFILFSYLFCSSVKADVIVGSERLFVEELFFKRIKGKNIGLITNSAAITKEFKTTAQLFMECKECTLKAIFAPEHGFYGEVYAGEDVKEENFFGKIPIHSLHGLNRRPTDETLKGIDLLVFDIQDIGSRSYTYLSTLFYCMEEAAKRNLSFIVLDRPNPLGGKMVDGPCLEKKWRSFLGYAAIPYCHGMTFGELAQFFNEEYQIGCSLTVIPMKGWYRGMTFKETGRVWAPTSPQIPEIDTPFFYPITGILGDLSFVSIGVGYTLPFKVVAAPWMEEEKFAEAMNQLDLPGVYFHPFVYCPFFGRYQTEVCKGIKIVVTDPNTYLPYTTCYALLGIIKTLYPEQFTKMLDELQNHPTKMATFHKLNGTEKIYEIISSEKFFIWKIRSLCQQERESFLNFRKKYLIPSY